MTTTINNEHKKLNVPNLRFPEFQGVWKEERLADIAKFYKGTGIPKDQLSDEGEPCILYGELYTKYKSETIGKVISKTNIDNTKLVKSKTNDVIIPCSGETAEDIATARCVLNDNILLGGDLNIIRLHGYDGTFMSYQLNGKRKYDIARVAQGVSVVHLYGEHLKGVKTINPCLEEQKKIANLLSLLDERIATQNKIIEDLKKLKSAIYQNLFFHLQGDKVPLSELAEIIKGQQINGSELSENGKYYVMNGGITPSGYYDNYNTEADTISISEGGNSCGYVQYNSSDFWSGGHCYTLRIKPTALISTPFLFHFLKWKEPDIMALRSGSGLPNIQKKDLSKVCIIVPTLDEQQQLIALLSTFQMKIENEEIFTSNLNKQKQHLLSQMFI